MAEIDHLVIGGSGQVGEALLGGLQQRGQTVAGTYRQHSRENMIRLDICDPQSVDALLRRLAPRTVFVPASLTNVDYCEQHPAEAYATNVTGIWHVIRAANAVQAKMVYFSSDYIFNGANGPYREDDPANPINEYGRQKLAAEHLIALHARRYLIIRTTVVYGWESQGKNFVYRLVQSLKNGQRVRVPVDQVGSPTYAPDLAAAVLDLVDREATGVFHVVGSDRASRYEFAVRAAEVFGLDRDLLDPVETRALGQAAPRPLNAGMVTDRIENVLNRPMIGYKLGLQAMAREQS